MTTDRNFVEPRCGHVHAEVLDDNDWKDELTNILDSYRNESQSHLENGEDNRRKPPNDRISNSSHSIVEDSFSSTTSGENGGGSTTLGAVFNFTNAIIGAGAMGLGGAIAESGGLISLLCLTVFAALAKVSCDMVVELKLFLADQEKERLTTPQGEIDMELSSEIHASQRYRETHKAKSNEIVEDIDSSSSQHFQNDNLTIQNNNEPNESPHCSSFTYEAIGNEAFGLPGRLAVSISKGLFSFGCLVAYVIVINDNFANGVEGAIYGTTEDGNFQSNGVRYILHHHHVWITVMLCITVILPMCLGRDISYLAKTSFVSILAVLGIVIIVLYLYFVNDIEDEQQTRRHLINPHIRMTNDMNSNTAIYSIEKQSNYESSAFHDHWIRVKGGLLESLGTFVFAFVPHHTIDMTFGSLRRPLQNYKTWKSVSTTSIGIAYVLSTLLGFIVYMTFWSKTQSDLFEMYPPSAPIYAAKLCLSVSMLLTFALPFFACREIIVDMASLMYDHYRQRQINNLPSSLTEALLPVERERLLVPREPFWLVSDAASNLSNVDGDMIRDMDQSDLPQLKLRTKYHVGLTLMLWSITVLLALAAPSLGDVLDLVGAVSGSMIGFVLPGFFHVRLLGFKGNLKGVVMLTSGLGICIVGTFFSSAQLVMDVFFAR